MLYKPRLLITAILVFIIYVRGHPHLKDKFPTADDEYLQAVLKNVDTSIEPCDDFYQFACGSWDKHYTEHYDMVGYMEMFVNSQHEELMEKEKNSSVIFEKVWNYYQSCLDANNITLNDYLKMLEEELEIEWPIFQENWLESWTNESSFDWLATVARLRLYGMNGVFFTMELNAKLRNGSHYLMAIESQYNAQLDFALRRNGIYDVFVAFGMSEDESDNITQKLVDLDEVIKNITMENSWDVQQLNMSLEEKYMEISIQKLMEEVPSLDWMSYFSIIRGVAPSKSEIVQNYGLELKYFEDLHETLQQTSNITLGYYIMVKSMYQILVKMPLSKRDEARNQICITHIRGHMPLALNYLYEKHIFKPRRPQVEPILNGIFQKLCLELEVLISVNHLNLTVKEQSYILEELKTMQLIIGNIPPNLNEQILNNYYHSLVINSNFVQNHLQALKFFFKTQMDRLKNQPLTDSEKFLLLDQEACSSSSPVKVFENKVLVPYGYLQSPLFHENAHSLFQYSLMGFVLAHEIVHAFDLGHIIFDANNNFDNIGSDIALHYANYFECSNQTDPTIVSENMADVTGIRLAYRTYFKADNSVHNLLSKIPHSGYTTEQLFFINSLQFLCASMTKISKLNISNLKLLEHEIHDKRVLQNWGYFEMFSTAFNCSKDAVMNPENKCRLW